MLNHLFSGGDKEELPASLLLHSFIHHSVHHPALFVLLFEDTVFPAYHSCIGPGSQPSALNSHPIEPSYILAISLPPWVLHSGSMLNSEITKKKHRTAKKLSLNHLRKGHLFIVAELQQGGGLSSCGTQLGARTSGSLKFAVLCASAKERREPVTLVWGLQKHFSTWVSWTTQTLHVRTCPQRAKLGLQQPTR